jgi:hypothetical protein
MPGRSSTTDSNQARSAIRIAVTGVEPEWVCVRLREIVGGLKCFVEESPNVLFGFHAVATDDLACPKLRERLEAVAARAVGLTVFAWDTPRKSRSLIGIAGLRLFLPDTEPDLARSALASMVAPACPKVIRLPRDTGIRPALSVAIGLLLRRASEPFGPAPSRNISCLARATGCRRETLSRSSAAAGIDLGALCRLSTIRWLRAKSEYRVDDLTNLASSIGFKSPRSLQRRLEAEVGVRHDKLVSGTSLSELDARLGLLISPTGAAPTSDHGPDHKSQI